MKNGYIGTVAGGTSYTKKRCRQRLRLHGDEGKAVTLFNKKGTEVEQEREFLNTRENSIYSRTIWPPSPTRQRTSRLLGTATVSADAKSPV